MKEHFCQTNTKEGTSMKLSRKLLLFVALTLSLAMVTGGTLAYLSDTDADVNTMTLGNVHIVQNVQERDAQGKLVPFTQDKPLYPSPYSGNAVLWANPANWPVPNDRNWAVLADRTTVVDKFVTVTNTGKSPAYLRTIVAVESTANPLEDGEYIGVVCNTRATAGPDKMSDWIWLTDAESLKVGDKYFHISYVTYLQPLQPGETSLPSVKQLFMTREANNEFVEKLGEKYDVLILSQAVQTDGFDDAETALNAAFGEVNLENAAEWFGGEPIRDVGSPGGTLPEGWIDNNPPIIP